MRDTSAIFLNSMNRIAKEDRAYKPMATTNMLIPFCADDSGFTGVGSIVYLFPPVLFTPKRCDRETLFARTTEDNAARNPPQLVLEDDGACSELRDKVEMVGCMVYEVSRSSTDS